MRLGVLAELRTEPAGAPKASQLARFGSLDDEPLALDVAVGLERAALSGLVKPVSGTVAGV